MTEQIFYTSPSMHIGKHEWRMIVSLHPHYGRITRYEWKKPDFRCGDFVISEGWKNYRDWHAYDFNDGMYAGLPKTLRRLWERYRPQIDAALGKEPAQISLF